METGVDGIPLDDVAASYRTRGLDTWSDDRLVAEVASVISVPRLDANSFILHAPLELMARRRMLQLVEPSARHLARLHILSIAAEYQTFDPLEDEGRPPTAGPVEATIAQLLESIGAGDLDGVDHAARRLESSPVDPVVLAAALAPSLLASTAAAAHAPIFLQYLLNVGRDGMALLPMIRPLARELARHPDWRIGWIHPLGNGGLGSGEPPDGRGDSLYQTLATAPRLGVPGSSFIHPILSQVDSADVAGTLLPPVLGQPGDLMGRDLLRVAAQSMLHDNPDEAPYGWTHCLTIPQAVLALGHAPEALAIAATQVLGFRCALGTNDLPDLHLGEIGSGTEVNARIAGLATAAATRHDAHIVKYALAVIDAAARDQEATGLYLSAGERLLSWWDSKGGDQKDRPDLE